MLNTYTDCFAKHPMDLGAIDVGDVPIPTITIEPVNLPPYRLALTEQQELQRQINELLKSGLITPSISSYSPRQFSKAVAKTLAGLLYVGTINYVDDIINYAKTFDDLLIILQKLLQRIRESGFKLKSTKCKFGYFELKILGQIVNQDGVKPNPEGLAAIKNFLTPKTIKQTRSFLGLCNFFRKFIPRFAELILPITDLTRGHNATKNHP